MDKSFSRKIIIFNFFYSLRVLCYHANAGVYFTNIVSSGSLSDRIAKIINLLLSSSGTQFFMLMSGFLLYRDLTMQNAARKVKSRLKTLLIPWLLWNVIGLISYHPFDKGIKYIIGNYLASHFCEQLWFVQALLIFLLFIPLFIKIFRIKIVREILLLLLFIAGYLGFPFVHFPDGLLPERIVLDIYRMLAHLPVYCLGVYLGINWSEEIISEQYSERYRTLQVLGAAGILIISYLPVDGFGCYVAGQVRSVALWVLCRKGIFDHVTIRWWMQIPFYTYAIHNFILHWIGVFLKMSGIFHEEFANLTVSVWFAVAWRLGTSVLAFVLVVISAAILIRFLPGFYRALTGGRIPEKG